MRHASDRCRTTRMPADGKTGTSMSLQEQPRRRAEPSADFEAVAEMIARDIQSGRLVPGQWLKQIDLETRYEAKRIVVRRALDRLVEKRLVEHLPNRGYHVHAPDGQRSDDIRDLRVILETAAVDSIIERATGDDIAAARALALRFAALLRSATLLELYDANLAFHQHLLALCSNKELVHLVNELRGRLSSAPAGQWHSLSRIEQSSAEHIAMAEALAARDGERLKALISAHIRQVPLAV
jgi:DNA-binding GntR family transcriptional regulator